MLNKNKSEIYYANEEYTIKMKKIDGADRYFLKFHSQIDSSEHEITFEIFTLYYTEFRKPLEKQRNEKRRHIENGGFDDLITSHFTAGISEDDKIVDKCTIESILKTCTSLQQKRFELHYVQGYSFTEIAGIEKCRESSIRDSINAVLKKIKNIL